MLTTLPADVFSSLGQLTHLFVGFNIVIIAWKFFSSIPYQFSLRLFSIKEAGNVFRLKLLCINLDKLYFTYLVVTHFLLGHVFVSLVINLQRKKYYSLLKIFIGQFFCALLRSIQCGHLDKFHGK